MQIQTKMDDEIDTEDLTNCQICCEEYSLDDRIPRFLPCTHTICEICIVQILSLESKGILCWLKITQNFSSKSKVTVTVVFVMFSFCRSPHLSRM